ncbi:MAG TPA: hypothetical protein VI731_02505 [Bacteroidia bacterium]|nr:hypothetical protein [Bacteroidia bacterium]
MRIVGQIPHPNFTISIFHMNDKFIIKLEAGPMEQSFKFPQDSVKGVEAVKKIVDAEFLQKAQTRFNEMFLEMKAAMERNVL